MTDTHPHRVVGCSLAGLLLALSLGSAAPAAADKGSLAIAHVRMEGSAAHVVATLGPPLERTRRGKAIVWRYSDRLVVYLRRKRPGGPRRVRGVRTRSPKDNVTIFPGVHVGAPVRRLRRGGEKFDPDCFTASIADPTGRRRAGRYCAWPNYVKFGDGEEPPFVPDLEVKAPVWVFRIEHKRIVSITMQAQPHRFPIPQPL